MNIGILGGTFDPIHIGHIHIARAALKEFKLDRIWLMPAGNPYFKAGKGVTDPKLRLKMTEAAADEEPDFCVCDAEINDTHETHTADTLTRLKKHCPEHRFFYIMGLDSLLQLHKWYRPDVILSSAVILCADRADTVSVNVSDDQAPFKAGTYADANMNAHKENEENSRKTADSMVRTAADGLCRMYPGIKPDIRLMHTGRLDISSSMIREGIKEGRDMSELVPPQVMKIIKQHKLYT